MKAKKPTATSNFHFISSFVWQQSPKRQFLAENHHQKLHLFVDLFFFRPKIDVCIYSNSHGHALVSIFAGHASAISLEPGSPGAHHMGSCANWQTIVRPGKRFCLSKFPHYPVHKLDLSCASQHAQKVITLPIFAIPCWCEIIVTYLPCNTHGNT